ncbi:DUF2141 domain-containing protein [Sphingomonas sp. ASV193]|uniref:DUF2141 domain-containing protein n=1 Tax=Sphingomonas sp. ASV193 TaxID=3144405 RepID=UPI0032E90EB2
MAGLRDSRGQIILCLTQRQQFMKCDDDPARISRSFPASRAGQVETIALAPGEWSLLLVHDENGNGKLDTWMGIPKEGFGFSRNPPIRFGPPSYDQVRFGVAADGAQQRIMVKYLI